jgi:hypothetical protein
MPFLLNTPLALYLLILIPFIIVLYFIKTAHHEVQLPAVYLWQETIQRAKKRSVLYAILQNIIPLLYVLTTLFIILAIGEPIFSTEKTSRVGVILDTSASMKTKVSGRTRRFDLALKRAMVDLTRLQRRQILVARASYANTKTFPPTTDSKTAVSNLQTLIPNDSGDYVEETITRIMAQSDEPMEFYVYTDHTLDIDRFGDRVHWVVFNQGKENVGITNFSLRRNPANPGEVSMLARIKNFGSSLIPVTFKIIKEGRTIHSQKIESNKTHSIALTHSEDGPLHLKAVLEAHDNYPGDNISWGYAPSSRPQRVLFVDVTDAAVGKAFNILPNVKLTRASYEQYMNLAGGEYDLAVFENREPDKYIVNNNIIINPTNKASSVFLSDPVEVENSSHPLLNFVELSDLVIPRAIEVIPAATATVLLRSGKIPLIYLEENPLRRVLYFSFSPEESNFLQKPSFPIFFMNAISFFRKSQITRGIVGEPIFLSSSEVTLIDPDGKRVSDIQKKVFRPRAVGLYRTGNTANFLIQPDPNESIVWKTEVPTPPVLPPGEFWAFFIHWRTFALLALILILFQWWYRTEKLHVRF